LKALHPSDVALEVQGVPDRSCNPTVMQHFNSISNFSVPADTVGPWTAQFQFLPNPVSFGWLRTLTNGETSILGSQNILNTQIEGDNITDKTVSFLSTNDRWRLAYYGVTIHLNAPTLADQGTVACCQRPLTFREFTFGVPTSGSGSDTPIATIKMLRPEDNDDNSTDYPNYDKMMSMPNAYTGNARDGVYAPLRLEKPDFDWSTRHDQCYWINAEHATGLDRGFTELDTSLSPTLPYPLQVVPAYYNTSTKVFGGGVGVPFLSENAIDCVFRGMSVNATITVTIRMGIESEVLPSSTYSMFQAPSPENDPVALKTYAALRRTMKDAYPAEYNDLNKLWALIKSGLKSAAPFLSAVNPLLGMAASKGPGLVDQAVKYIDRPKKKVAVVPVPPPKRRVKEIVVEQVRPKAPVVKVEKVIRSVPIKKRA